MILLAYGIANENKYGVGFHLYPVGCKVPTVDGGHLATDGAAEVLKIFNLI